jgi:DNA-binding CsgD family transcriptional regulator
MRQVYARMQAAAHAGELPIEPLARELMRGLLAIIAGQLDDAEQILSAVAEREEQVGLLVIYGSARPLLAHLALLRQRPAEALAALEPWLADCARYNTPGRALLEGAYVVPLLRLAVEHKLHADFATRTLALLPSIQPADAPAPLRVPATGEILTAREVEVLRLLALGATNKAIAEQLIIGEQTVKTHVARILRKLDATTRTEAAARARALGIV